jgi:hypothetical protein
MVVHILKTVMPVWDAIYAGEKTFEVRKNDRFFQKGDLVILRKIDEYGHYVKKLNHETTDLQFKIGWMLQGGQFGIESGYCVFQLEPCEE